MRTFSRYLFFQVPQWILLALFIWLLVDRTTVPLWLSIGFFALWIVKDIGVYPWVRRAYETEAKTGAARLIGEKAVTQERLDPQGYVKIRGELWRARAEPNHQPIGPNITVRVRDAHGLTLIVENDRP